MMKNIGTVWMCGVGLVVSAMAQQGEAPFVSPQERQAVEDQNEQIQAAVVSTLSEVSKSTVRVWAGNRRLAYGTVVLDGQKVLTKWSEVARGRGRLMVEDYQGKAYLAKVVGGYVDDDLVILQIEGGSLPVVKWSDQEIKLGSFVVASQPNGQSAGIGVVSVLERNMRDQDQAFIGLVGEWGYQGPGVRIQEVSKGSGADQAGLRPGQVVLKVGNRPLSGLMELRNALSVYKPGQMVDLVVATEGGEKSVKVELGARPALPKFPSDRLGQMARMGGELSRYHDGFSRVVQTDMRLSPNQVGGPLVNLKGQVVGVSVARAERTKSYFIGSARIQELLKQEPQDMALARNSEVRPQMRPMLRGDEGGEEMPLRMRRPRLQMAPDRMRAHMEQMEQLLDIMRQEMEQLGFEP